MSNTILKELGIYVCDCGILLQLDKLKSHQFDWERHRQRYECPICKSRINIGE